MRILALATLSTLVLASSCASTADVRPSEAGTWRVGGSTGGIFKTTDAGSLGDRMDYGAELSVGHFIARKLMLEVAVDASFTEIEIEDEADAELGEVSAVGGFRYYFEHTGRSRPYVGLGAGISTFDFEAEGVDESDTALSVVGRAGFETFLSNTVTLDFGVRITQVFDREIDGVEEDILSGAFVIGLAAWF